MEAVLLVDQLPFRPMAAFLDAPTADTGPVAAFASGLRSVADWLRRDGKDGDAAMVEEWADDAEYFGASNIADLVDRRKAVREWYESEVHEREN